MSKKKRAAKATEVVEAVKENQYVQRLLGDEELRDTLRSAYESAQDAYGRLSNGKAPTKALMEDKKLQKELRNAATALRDASTALREGPKRKRRTGRRLMVVAIGGVLAVALSENLRTKVLDTLLGKEEEFEYAPTAPVTPAPAPAPTPAAG